MSRSDIEDDVEFVHIGDAGSAVVWAFVFGIIVGIAIMVVL